VKTALSYCIARCSTARSPSDAQRLSQSFHNYKKARGVHSEARTERLILVYAVHRNHISGGSFSRHRLEIADRGRRTRAGTTHLRIHVKGARVHGGCCRRLL
jgi:hypothetical protein